MSEYSELIIGISPYRDGGTVVVFCILRIIVWLLLWPWIQTL